VRLFVAVDVGGNASYATMELVARLRARVERQAPGARVSWAAAGRLHMTLSFIGEADDERLGAIIHVLRPSYERGPIELGVSGVGVFPDRGAPRVVWAGIDVGRDEIIALQRLVAARLASVGVPPEPRAYHPHITLARIREPAGLRSTPLLDGLATARIGTFEARAVTLFESRPSPKGPSYVAVHRTELYGG
jgi:2'-5' RNA ligase